MVKQEKLTAVLNENIVNKIGEFLGESREALSQYTMIEAYKALDRLRLTYEENEEVVQWKYKKHRQPVLDTFIANYNDLMKIVDRMEIELEADDV